MRDRIHCVYCVKYMYMYELERMCHVSCVYQVCTWSSTAVIQSHLK